MRFAMPHRVPESMTVIFFTLLTIRTTIWGQAANEVPMYGNIQKTPKQLKSDKTLVETIIEKVGSRDSAFNITCEKAWDAFYGNDLKTAIKRFNQAWLIDSTKAEAYWGFGIYLGSQDDLVGAIAMLKKAEAMDTTNARIKADLAFSESRYAKTLPTREETEVFFESADDHFRKSEAIDSTYAYMYYQWAILDFYRKKYDDAWSKTEIAKKRGLEISKDDTFIKDLKKEMRRRK